MKVQCACGAKFAFEVTPDMAQSPALVVCPACGLDVSEYVRPLIRDELANMESEASEQEPPPQAAPLASPVTARPAAVPAAKPIPVPKASEIPPPTAPPHTPGPIRVAVGQASTGAPQAAPARAQICSKHPTQQFVAKCFVCGKGICPECMALFGYLCSPLCKAKADSHGLKVPIYAGQKSLVEARYWRKVGTAGAAVAVLLLAFLGLWIWYAWFGSHPKPVFAVRFPDPVYSGQSEFAGENQIVFLHGDTLARYDLKTKKPVWSRSLINLAQIEKQADKELKDIQGLVTKAQQEGWDRIPRVPSRERLIQRAKRAAAAQLQLKVKGTNIWVANAGKLILHDWQTGSPGKELAVAAGFNDMIARGDEMWLIEAGRFQPQANLTRINLRTGETRVEDLRGGAVAQLSGPGSGESGGPALSGLPVGTPGRDSGKPMDPARVAEQIQSLSFPARAALPAVLSNSRNQERMLEELKNPDAGRDTLTTAKPGETVMLVPANDRLVQYSVKLVEAIFVDREAMKPASGKSVLDGKVTVLDTTDAANEILNEMQRSRGGGTVRENHSRYQVTVRKPGEADDQAWTAEVIGEPTLYPLQTVSVIGANNIIRVLDKDNRKLWQAQLNFNIRGGLEFLSPENAPEGRGPCVEHKGTLYVFDDGELTAFDLKTGKVNWRHASVGIAGMFIDHEDQIYINTTSADVSSLQFSRQINVANPVGDVIQKLDPVTGSVLWTAEPGGTVSHVEGKFVFIVQARYPADDDEEDEMFKSETGYGGRPPFLKIKRLDPRAGRVLWEHFQERAPLDIQFDQNRIRLVFKKEVQVLKFLSI